MRFMEFEDARDAFGPVRRRTPIAHEPVLRTPEIEEDDTGAVRIKGCTDFLQGCGPQVRIQRAVINRTDQG